MQPKSTQEYLTVGEAAKRIGISCDTLKRWESAGRIASFRTPTGHRRFQASEVDALLTGEATA